MVMDKIKNVGFANSRASKLCREIIASIIIADIIVASAISIFNHEVSSFAANLIAMPMISLLGIMKLTISHYFIFAILSISAFLFLTYAILNHVKNVFLRISFLSISYIAFIAFGCVSLAYVSGGA